MPNQRRIVLLVLIFGSLSFFDSLLGSSLNKKLPAAVDTFKALNADASNPFAMSVGISMSQTHQTDNTVNRQFVRKAVHNMIKKLSVKDALAWIKHKDRAWFALSSLPQYQCENGAILNPAKLDPVQDAAIIDSILTNLATNRTADNLTLLECPEFCAGALTEMPYVVPVFTSAHQEAMLTQLRYINVLDQFGSTKGGLPNFRLSLEIADVLKSGTDKLDPVKMQDQAQFINAIGNPLLFFHHYSNPQVKSQLFTHEADIKWFSNYCLEVLKLSPQVTHVCPVSQPVAFEYKVKKGMLPPFVSSNDKVQEIMMKAQLEAARQMKSWSAAQNESTDKPTVQVLISHQWKPMKPKHTGYGDHRAYLESLVCSIAHNMYNGKFVKLVKPYIDDFDGIALSVYPALYFNLWSPEGSNTSGVIDYEGALEAIVETSKAFPGKDIYIVETGCNTKDSSTKRQFIDMTLYACKVARDQGIPVKGVYFWGENNDPDFYSEWNSPQGSTNFGPFDALDPISPLASINAAGLYMRDILSNKA